MNKHLIIQQFLSKPNIQLFLHGITIPNLYLEILPDLNNLFTFYNLHFSFISQQTIIPFNRFYFFCHDLHSQDLDYFLPIFFLHFFIYPTTFIKNINLQHIIFTGRIDIHTNQYTQERKAIPDYPNNTLYFSCNSKNFNYIFNLIPHEIFHFFHHSNDTYWYTLNQSNFQYGNGGAYYRQYQDLNPNIKGFLNFYSTTDIKEDQAEIFAHLITNPISLSKNHDPIIQSKIRYILNLLDQIDPIGFKYINNLFL